MPFPVRCSIHTAPRLTLPRLTTVTSGFVQSNKNYQSNRRRMASTLYGRYGYVRSLLQARAPRNPHVATQATTKSLSI